MEAWLEVLLSGKPGANTVLKELDYDRYATAEAVLGWLNGAFRLSARKPFDPRKVALSLAVGLREGFKSKNAEVGHLKLVITSGGKSIWTNLTHLAAEPVVSGEQVRELSQGTLILNARVRINPDQLEAIVRASLDEISQQADIQCEVVDLQCFTPAYPTPPHLIRETVKQ